MSCFGYSLPRIPARLFVHSSVDPVLQYAELLWQRKAVASCDLRGMLVSIRVLRVGLHSRGDDNAPEASLAHTSRFYRYDQGVLSGLLENEFFQEQFNNPVGQGTPRGFVTIN